MFSQSNRNTQGPRTTVCKSYQSCLQLLCTTFFKWCSLHLKTKSKLYSNEMLSDYCSCLLKPFKRKTYTRVVDWHKKTLEERCLMILRECGPSTVPQLFKELKRRGLHPHGKTPKNTVSATVSERCGRKPGHPLTFVRRKNADGHFVYFTPLQDRLSPPGYSGSEMGTWGVRQRTGRKTSPSRTPDRKYS